MGAPPATGTRKGSVDGSVNSGTKGAMGQFGAPNAFTARQLTTTLVEVWLKVLSSLL